MNPRVSIIIPTYNCAGYITEAIESALKQTYRNLEIIVIDDGSDDNTKQEIETYIEKGLVEYIYQENQGPSSARNSGIQAAKGDYIAFLDADDTLTQDSIKLRIDLITSSQNVGLVFSEYFYEAQEYSPTDSKLYQQIKKRSKLVHVHTHGMLIDGSFQDVFENIFLIHTSTVLVQRRVFEKAGLFKRDISIGEDRDMWLRIAEHYKIGFVVAPLAYYKRYRSYLTVKDPLKYDFNRLYFNYNLLKKYYKVKTVRRFLYKRLAIVYYDLANYYYEEKIKMQFYLNITKSICYNPFDRLAFKLLFFSFIPRKLRDILKNHSFVS